jgi:hypothetical protein
MTETVAFFDSLPTPAPKAAVQFFDPPMCCPTGLCGPAVDQMLLDVNEMILSLQSQGITVERYQMTSHPQVFLSNAEVMRLVREQQMAALPIIVVNGKVIKSGAYPTLNEVQACLIEAAG